MVDKQPDVALSAPTKEVFSTEKTFHAQIVKSAQIFDLVKNDSGLSPSDRAVANYFSKFYNKIAHNPVLSDDQYEALATSDNLERMAHFNKVVNVEHIKSIRDLVAISDEVRIFFEYLSKNNKLSNNLCVLIGEIVSPDLGGQIDAANLIKLINPFTVAAVQRFPRYNLLFNEVNSKIANLDENLQNVSEYRKIIAETLNVLDVHKSDIKEGNASGKKTYIEIAWNIFAETLNSDDMVDDFLRSRSLALSEVEKSFNSPVDDQILMGDYRKLNQSFEQSSADKILSLLDAEHPLADSLLNITKYQHQIHELQQKEYLLNTYFQQMQMPFKNSFIAESINSIITTNSNNLAKAIEIFHQKKDELDSNDLKAYRKAKQEKKIAGFKTDLMMPLNKKAISNRVAEVYAEHEKSYVKNIKNNFIGMNKLIDESHAYLRNLKSSPKVKNYSQRLKSTWLIKDFQAKTANRYDYSLEKRLANKWLMPENNSANAIYLNLLSNNNDVKFVLNNIDKKLTAIAENYALEQELLSIQNIANEVLKSGASTLIAKADTAIDNISDSKVKAELKNSRNNFKHGTERTFYTLNSQIAREIKYLQEARKSLHFELNKFDQEATRARRKLMSSALTMHEQLKFLQENALFEIQNSAIKLRDALKIDKNKDSLKAELQSLTQAEMKLLELIALDANPDANKKMPDGLKLAALRDIVNALDGSLQVKEFKNGFDVQYKNLRQSMHNNAKNYMKFAEDIAKKLSKFDKFDLTTRGHMNHVLLNLKQVVENLLNYNNYQINSDEYNKNKKLIVGLNSVWQMLSEAHKNQTNFNILSQNLSSISRAIDSINKGLGNNSILRLLQDSIDKIADGVNKQIERQNKADKHRHNDVCSNLIENLNTMLKSLKNNRTAFFDNKNNAHLTAKNQILLLINEVKSQGIAPNTLKLLTGLTDYINRSPVKDAVGDSYKHLLNIQAELLQEKSITARLNNL